MSRPNTMFQDRQRDDAPLFTGTLPEEAGETALPGVALELGAFSKQWDDINMAIGRFLTDAKFANTEKQLAPLEASTDAIFTQIGKAAALVMHARKAVTAKRVQERKRG
jgi:hypothetical protein